MTAGFHSVLFLSLTSGLLISGTWSTSSEDDCPDGWTFWECRCFIFKNSPKTMRAAESDCNHLGGNLASIHSRDEHNFVRDLIRADTSGVNTRSWIGLTDEVKEGEWVWTDGSDVDYTNWHRPNQPDNFGSGEDCVMINYDGGPWNDYPCDAVLPDGFLPLPFVCAKDDW